ncbi:MAG TPA: response regulator [Ktedonobacteraceae bacterium]
MNAIPVMLVDDDQMLLRALSETITLRMSTVTVETVTSTQEALQLLQEREYSAIISDIQMPGMDGLELLSHVQKHYPDIPVLLITGYNDQKIAIEAVRAGAYDYIRKPIERDDFIAALTRALSTYRLRQQVREQQQTLELYALSIRYLMEHRAHE